MGAPLSRGGGRFDRPRLLAEINVTPLVDVMLVLLIVFMITAPLLTVGVTVDLPETEAGPISESVEPLTVTITAEGKVFIQEQEIDPKAIVAQLERVAERGYDQRIYVRGDKAVSYGDVMKIMARINSAGFRSLALVTESDVE